MKGIALAFEDQIRPQLTQLNSIFEQSVTDGEVSTVLTKALAYIAGLELLVDSVSDKKEHPVFVQALQEIQYSLLSVSIGNYRHAYSSLRLFFELYLAAAEFSANLRYFRKWELGQEDIYWSRLSDPESGVLSKNYCSLFFSEIADEAPQFGKLATTVYRECSEFVHGNPKATSTLPDTIQFKKETVIDWANKLDSMCLVISFIFSARYLVELPIAKRERTKEYLLAQLGHIEPIREILGGVVGG